MTISDFFIPNRQLVNAITRANPTVIETTQDHGYSSGLFVRFFFPLDTGMPELANNVYEITVLTSTTFSINVDSTNFDPYSPVGSIQLAQIIPVGSESISVLEPVQNNGNIVPETSWIQN